jgi:hypothetical protein
MLKWEKVENNDDGTRVLRAKVPGGWLVMSQFSGTGLTFYPDPDHSWTP